MKRDAGECFGELAALSIPEVLDCCDGAWEGGGGRFDACSILCVMSVVCGARWNVVRCTYEMTLRAVCCDWLRVSVGVALDELGWDV